jgi:hypothetical protein
LVSYWLSNGEKGAILNMHVDEDQEWTIDSDMRNSLAISPIGPEIEKKELLIQRINQMSRYQWNRFNFCGRFQLEYTSKLNQTFAKSPSIDSTVKVFCLDVETNHWLPRQRRSHWCG